MLPFARTISRSYSHLRLKTSSNPLKNGLSRTHIRDFHSTFRKYNLNDPKTLTEASESGSTGLRRQLLYRKDGSLRSKKKGFLYGTLGLSLVLLIKISVDLEDFFYRIDAVIEISNIDESSYSSTDWSSYPGTCSYFSKILTPLLVKPGYAKPESVQNFFKRLEEMRFENFGQQKVHGIMREAGREIHKSLNNPQEVPKLKEMGEILRGALEGLEAELHLQGKRDEELSGWIMSLREGERTWK
ncbi:hypothetical protein K435DRAFT_858081 [Dendrothele bispora CBS 962.96]|uniref:Uncharacterized protein n=1 Tax=Dendrothele bispora (strain CBS 962.96) TaxID=1314807 RepID=A0A4V4HG06_DENBC|nr:hypothetical protein K435DRAFT_858081 [Dendrothele bispora CBS 962.96]